eukprot:TRINITY_DN3198_c0_g1_i1.p1 TRINITY_DN3198_c0_g1~~TRINITY_DN3198_c0_g1_i1.p1  ORF type:complete len:290 (-),score=62.57 TRINITY_DN3198_c0_g1_i1:26-850(-)
MEQNASNASADQDSIQFQIMSDLHIEFFVDEIRIEKFEPKAPYVALLGDIGNPRKPLYEKFIEEQSKQFKEVFVLAGNHEYYTNVYEDAQKMMVDICAKFPNVHFMQKKSVKIGKYRILGTTLWSHVPDDNAQQVQRSLNDYAMISTREQDGKTRKIRIADTNRWFKDELEWLEGEIKAAKEAGEEVVVMTHHAPTMKKTSAPQYENSAINCAFATDLEHLFGPPVKAWFYGHTHYSNDQKFNGTRVVSNQHGYFMGKENTGYRKEMVVEIKKK